MFSITVSGIRICLRRPGSEDRWKKLPLKPRLLFLSDICPMRDIRRSGRNWLIFQENDSLEIDPLAMNLARAFRWQSLIDSGTYRNTGDLAEAIGKDPAFVARMIRLTLLAPEIVHAILAGTLRKSIPMDKLSKTMPERWADQKKLFGFE